MCPTRIAAIREVVRVPLLAGGEMATQTTRTQRAAADLAAHALVYRPEDIVDRLQAGLTQLRDQLAGRLHVDVERQFGVDSMVAPLSLSHEVSQMQSAANATDAYAAVLA